MSSTRSARPKISGMWSERPSASSKKAGLFPFREMFAQKALYGDMEDLVKELKAEGFAEVHYIANIENQNQLVPKFIQTPWMIKGAGVLYGVK